MTTVVAIQGDGYVVMGTDSRLSATDANGFVSRVHTMSSNVSKISQNNGMLIGLAGDVRAINLIAHSFQAPQASPSLRGKKLDDYITNKFVPSLRACFDLHGYSAPQRDTSEHMAEQGSEILLSINAVIYQIDNDYAWSNDASGLYAIGTGGQYAIGALAALLKTKNTTMAMAKKQCLNALAIAAKYDPHTGYPYQTFQQEGISVERRNTRTRTSSKA